jgi:hypothetical protein
MDELWDGRIEVASGRPVTAHIDVRSSDDQPSTSVATMQRWQLSTLIEKAQPNLHRWNQNLTLSIEKVTRDIGWRPRHNFLQAVDLTFDWFQRDQVAQQTQFDFAFEDAVLEVMLKHS